MDFKKQMEMSAFMCSQWNNLNNRIKLKKDSIKKPQNINTLAFKKAEAEYNKIDNSIKGMFIKFLKGILCFLVLPSIPVMIALFLYFYLNIKDQTILKICFGASILIFILNQFIFNIYSKKRSKNKIEKIKEQYSKQFEQQNKKIAKENQLLQKEIQELQRRKNLLESKMREECIIHPDYWCVASQLYYLIDCGRAESLKEAINLFEHIREEEAKRIREEALAEELRWNRIVAEQQHEEIMSEIKSHNDMMELAAFAAYINSK